MAEKIDDLYIQIYSDSSIATRAIGKLVSSLKMLKKELGSGFTNNAMNSTVKSFDGIKNKMKDLSKDNSLDKLSEKIQKATNVKTDNLEKYKQSLKGLTHNITIPSTFAEIEKQLKALVPQYEKLIEKQNKAIAMNNGIEPDTKSYRNLLYDLNKVVETTKQLSKARLSMTPEPEQKKSDDVDTILARKDALEKEKRAYDGVAESKERATKRDNIPVDDPTNRLKEFMKKAEENQRDYSERISEIWKMAAENVAKNFNLSDTIKGNESSLNSLITRLGNVRESLQQAFDLSRVQEGSQAWETYQYKIAAVSEKIKIVEENIKAMQDQNAKLDVSGIISEGLDKTAKNVGDVFRKASENIDKNFKVPSSIKELERLVPSLEKKLATLNENLQKDVDRGKVEEGSKAWDDYAYKIGMVNSKLDITRKKLSELRLLERQLTQMDVAPTTEPTKSTGDTGKDVSTKALTATVSFATLSKVLGQFSANLDRMSGKMTTLLVNLYTPLRKVLAEYKDKLGQIGNIFKVLGNTVEKAANKIRVKWNNLVHSFSKMVMRRALYAVLTTINDAMGSLANFVGVTGQKFNEAMSNMTSSARYAGANIVAAFSPLVTAIAPMIDALVEKMVSAITVINQFFAALTGNSVFVKAKKVVTDYGESVKKATKAQKDLVLGIDELNINNPNQDTGSGAGAEGDLYEWEEAPVLNSIKDFADKVRDIFDKLFDPLKKAWDRAGDYVISGFKYMVGEIGKLAAAIGEDFLTMWQEEATVRIFENILGIIGDIEYTIGNLARNFREAWEENDTGLEIFRNMRDILGILVEHVRNVTQAMKEWSETVDFRPMLTSFRDMLESLKPVADFIGGVFEDVMNNVVIRYIDWMISDGIPHLNNTIASIADAFDWEKMRSDMVPVEEAFGNLAIAIHEGTVNALGNLGRALAGITNTETFTKFMENIARIINLIDAELVEKVLTALGNCILDVANALVKFVGSDKFTAFLENVKKYLDSLTVEDIEGKIKGLAIAIGLFKFGAFVGNGVVAATKFLTFVSTLKTLTGASTAISAVAGSLVAVGEAVIIVAGVFFHLKNIATLFNNIKDAINEGDLPKALGNVALMLLAILNPAASAGAAIAKFVYDTGVQMGILKKDGKSLRDAVEEDVKANSNALRDQRKTTEEETRTMGEKFKDLAELIKKSGQSAKEGIETSFKGIGEKFSGFTDKIKESGESMKEGIENAFKGIGEYMSQTFENLSEKASRVWDDIKRTVHDAIESIKGFLDFEWKWPDIKLPHFSIEGEFNLMEGRIPHISVEWYAGGGFLGSPKSYSLFGMGENGIPEILGTVGGKSAVAGGEEITGIRDQVYESGVAEQELLGQAISLLQIIADKDFNVDLDGRSMVTALNSRSARNGYSMATVS